VIGGRLNAANEYALRYGLTLLHGGTVGVRRAGAAESSMAMGKRLGQETLLAVQRILAPMGFRAEERGR